MRWITIAALMSMMLLSLPPTTVGVGDGTGSVSAPVEAPLDEDSIDEEITELMANADPNNGYTVRFRCSSCSANCLLGTCSICCRAREGAATCTCSLTGNPSCTCGGRSAGTENVV